MEARKDKIQFFQRLEKTILQLSGEEIVKNMIEGLRAKHVIYNAYSFGHKKCGEYYGDAACSTIINIMKNDNIDAKIFLTPRLGSYDDGFHSAHRHYNPNCGRLIQHFENALDKLSRGCVFSYNNIARIGKISKLKSGTSVISLPNLSPDFLDLELKEYEKLAKIQGS
jgi:hypothetical protein